MKVLNALGHPVKWVWVMKKLNTPLSVSSYPAGTMKGAEVFGYPTPIRSTWYDHGDIYFDEEEIALIRSFIRYMIEADTAYPDRMARTIFSLSRVIGKHHIPKGNLQGKGLHQLIALLKREQQLFLQMIGFMSYRGSIQMSEVLTERLRTILQFRLAVKGKAHQVDRYLDRLSVPLFGSIVAEEKRAALQASVGWKRLTNRQRAQRLRTHRRKFNWMAYHWFVGHPRSDAELHQRFARLTIRAAQDLKDMRGEARNREQTVREIERELGLLTNERRMVRQFRTWLFLRTFVKDNINQAGYELLPLLHAIADRIGVEHHLIPFLTLQEIHSLPRFSLIDVKRRIQKRLRGFGGGIVDLQFRFGSFPGEKILASGKTEPEEVIKGSVAFAGVVRGVVRVLHGPSEQRSLKRGEILVTSMTTPDLLPAMEKAAAFVTDEGGITSHAAIVAREMKKPCIIGTKNATRTLKDGDRVEVDATRGIVRKVTR